MACSEVATVALAAGVALLCLACGTQPSTRPEPIPESPSQGQSESRFADVAELSDSNWATVESWKTLLSVMLPYRSSWVVWAERWFIALHPATESELRLRIWRAGRLPDRKACAHQAELWLPKLRQRGDIVEPVIASRTLEAPAGFDTELVAYAFVRAPRELEGVLTAFGAGISRCFAAVYTTRARGPEAQHAIGRRLALVAEKVLPKVVSLGIDDRGRY